jgi:hypothetical protein
MHKMHQYAIVIPSLLQATSGVRRAQNVMITPCAPTMALGKTLQFSGRLTDSSNGDVIWSAGGVIGGSAVAGTISPTGHYHAPATLPAQNPVQITATSKANPAKTSTIYVYLIAAAPRAAAQ